MLRVEDGNCNSKAVKGGGLVFVTFRGYRWHKRVIRRGDAIKVTSYQGKRQ